MRVAGRGGASTLVGMASLRVGLNAYGIAYATGFMGVGTPRANREPLGMAGFIDLAMEIGAGAISLPMGWLGPLDEGERRALADRLAGADVQLIVDGAVMEHVEASLAMCEQMGAGLMRSTLSTVLEGGRAARGTEWHELVGRIPGVLQDAARQAREMGVTIGLENHQDFTSAELAAFCDEAGDGMGICYDVGNALSVGEDPVLFARTIARHLALLHLKDYYVQWTDEGYRLVRCAIGSGAVAFEDVVEALEDAGCAVAGMPALIESGALENRHIRLLCDDWWEGYPARTARDLAVGLAAARRGLMDGDADWRTPWEAGADGDEIVAYEMGQLRESVANMKKLGWM